MHSGWPTSTYINLRTHIRRHRRRRRQHVVSVDRSVSPVWLRENIPVCLLRSIRSSPIGSRGTYQPLNSGSVSVATRLHLPSVHLSAQLADYQQPGVEQLLLSWHSITARDHVVYRLVSLQTNAAASKFHIWNYKLHVSLNG